MKLFFSYNFNYTNKMDNAKYYYYIYIIQEREFIRMKEDIYKVGITKDILRCYNEYPKSSKLIYTRICNTNFEKEILKKLEKNFIQKREYGTEYFEGDYNEIIICINKIIDEYNKPKCISDKEYGWCKLTRISDELAEFLGKETGTEMARTAVTRDINAYIRANSLQDTDNGRKINPDTKLATLLKLTKEDELTYFNLQRYMSPHFHKNVKIKNDEDDEDDD